VISPEFATNTSEPSEMHPAMKVHTIIPTRTCGSSVARSRPNSAEYRMPSAMAVTAMLMVIQIGPRTERR